MWNWRTWLLWILCAALAQAQDPAAEALLQRLYPQADARTYWQRSYTAEEQASIEQRAQLKPAPRQLEGWSFYQRGALLGHALVDDVRGKHRPITFLLATDAQLRVRALEILAYRESHGGEVRAADWRAQFRDKGPESVLALGRDIQNIAGATISCRNLTLGVRVRLVALSLGVGSAAPAALPSSTSQPELGLRSQLLMGTLLSVQIEALDADRARRAGDAVFEEVRRVESVLSDWMEDSKLAQWQRAAQSGFAALDPELDLVLAECKELHTLSAGAFDVGIGPLVRLWRENSAPSALELESARAASGIAQVEYDPRQRTARLRQPQARLDFGAYGKGYALRTAAARLRSLGVEQALLDFGGQLYAVGNRAWPVQLSKEFPELGPLSLRGLSMAVSSTEQRGAHVLDPRTGLPVSARRAVLTLGTDPAQVDAWSTALFVWGPAGLDAAQAQGIGALIVEADGQLRRNARLGQEWPQLARP